MSRAIPLLFALLFPLAAHAGLSVSDEHPVAAPVVVPGGGIPPVIAAAGPDAIVASSAQKFIQWTPIRQPGVVAPTQHFATHDAANLSMVWTGRTYLLLWREGASVMSATLTRDGQLAAAPRMVLAEHYVEPHALAWNGGRALLVVTSATTGATSGALFDSDGNLLRRDVFVGGDIGSALPSVVAADGIFFVFWMTTRNVAIATDPPPPSRIETTIRVSRVYDTGASLDLVSRALVTTDQVFGPLGLASDGGTIALSCFAAAYPAPELLHRYLIDPLTLAVTPLPGVRAGGFSSGLLWSGTTFVAFWSEYDSVNYRVWTLPFTNASPNVVVSGAKPALDITGAAGGGEIYLTWTDTSRGGHDAVAVALSRPEPFFVSYPVRAEEQAAIAEGLAAWIEAGPADGFGDLVASRLDANGRAIDGPIPLSITGLASLFMQPRVVFTGSIWMVVWTEGVPNVTRTLMRRIARDGTLIDAAPLPFVNASSLAFNGRTILAPYIGVTGDLLAKRLDANGNDLGTITIASKAFAWDATAASNGFDFLVVWGSGSDYWQFPAPNFRDVIGARVSAGGTLLDPRPINIAVTPADEIVDAVASNGRDYLVAYRIMIFAEPRAQLMLQRVTRFGADDGAPIAAGDPIDQNGTSLRGDASGYWLARDAGKYDDPFAEVFHLDGDANVLDRAAVAISIINQPQIAARGNEAHIAYARWDADAGAVRVFTRRIAVSGPHERAAGR